MQSSSHNVTTNKHTPTYFTGWMPFLSPNQQCQSTEGKNYYSLFLTSENETVLLGIDWHYRDRQSPMQTVRGMMLTMLRVRRKRFRTAASRGRRRVLRVRVAALSSVRQNLPKTAAPRSDFTSSLISCGFVHITSVQGPFEGAHSSGIWIS